MGNVLQKYRKEDAEANIQRMLESINYLSSVRSGKTKRSATIAMLKCIAVLRKDLQRSISE